MTTLFVVLFKFNMELQKIYFFGIIKTLVEEKNFIKIQNLLGLHHIIHKKLVTVMIVLHSWRPQFSSLKSICFNELPSQLRCTGSCEMNAVSLLLLLSKLSQSKQRTSATPLLYGLFSYIFRTQTAGGNFRCMHNNIDETQCEEFLQNRLDCFNGRIDGFSNEKCTN